MASPELPDHIEYLLNIASGTGQRPLLWLAGSDSHSGSEVCRIISVLADKLLSESSGITWVSRAFGDKKKFPPKLWQVLEAHQVSLPVHRTHLLGTQSSVLIYDAHQGFDPDLFCLASGTLEGGGLLILLAPDAAFWIKQPDPDYQRMLIYRCGSDQIAGRFIRHVTQQFYASDIVSVVDLTLDSQNKPIAGSLPASPRLRDPGEGVTYTEEQISVINAVKGVAKTRQGAEDEASPVVVTADRGRGKSSALGAGIGMLAESGLLSDVWVTAPSKENVRVLFRHAAARLGVALEGGDKLALEVPALRVRYLAPDDALARLKNDSRQCDLLVIDEAAGIPEGLLKALTRHSPRIVLATTIHGYEGTGRGFQIRFQPFLDSFYPRWQLLTMAHPVRWGQMDLLEQTLNRMFFLDADPVMPPESVTISGIEEVAEVSQDELLANKGLLEQVFTLLMFAHYRTSPGDLRDLLDGLNLRIFILRQGHHVLGCCLVAMEGPLDESMVDAVYRGKRRPRGHLLPQTLCQCLGCTEPASELTARVVRIAILPDRQRRGLGSRLLDQVEAALTEEGIHYTGSSFGAYPDVIDFWLQNGYSPVRLGFTREQSSGAHSLLVIKELGGNDRAQHLVSGLRKSFSGRFAYLLRNEFSSLDPAIVNSLEQVAATDEQMIEANQCDQSMVYRFVEGACTFEDARYDLWLMWSSASRKPIYEEWLSHLSNEQQALLSHLFAENHRLSGLGKPGLVTGKKDAVSKLRDSFGRLMKLKSASTTLLTSKD